MIDVSICIISYNQEKYIAEAIESALKQKYSFNAEIIICDDKSTDNTPNIIEDYAKKFPQKIKSYPASGNLGMLRNWERALKLCRGRYIAILEGDDFWNDEAKLQKQFEILEANPSYSFCFTNATIKYESGVPGFPQYVTITGTEFSTVDLLPYNFVPTCSVLMRNSINESFFHPAYYESPFADWIIHILNSQKGNFYFLNEYACTYRAHGTGVWGGINAEKQLKNRLRAINCIDGILKDSKFKPGIRANQKDKLQKLCALYKQQGQWLAYFKHRLKLFLI